MTLSPLPGAGAAGPSLGAQIGAALAEALHRFLSVGSHSLFQSLAAATPVAAGCAIALFGLGMIASGEPKTWGSKAVMALILGAAVRLLAG